MALVLFSAIASADAVDDQILAAGNAATDEARLALLQTLATNTELSDAERDDVKRLCDEIEQWISAPRLYFFDKSMKPYDMGIASTSRVYPLTLLYLGRAHIWQTLEYGGYYVDPAKRRARFDEGRAYFEAAAKAFPENPIVAMYLGTPIPAQDTLNAPANAPAWAVAQRESLQQLTAIVHWWIDHRMRDDGQYGGGWGDDCEMWRWWTPLLIGFEDPKINEAQERFSRALFSQDHMREGFTSHMSDVEHTAEDSADAISPMMFIDANNPEWRAKALRLSELMETKWTGVNERGQLQFKSTYFTVDKVDDTAKRACDTVYHPRAVQPALIYWQRTRDAHLTDFFSRWMDTWVDATQREERGKPAGVVPSAIHWPDGAIGGLGKNWWDPENHNEDPLYVWPSAMSQMLHTLLQTYVIRNDERYLAPIRSMAALRLLALSEQTGDDPAPGTAMWCGLKMGDLSSVLGKYKALTGSTEFAALLTRDPSPYAALRFTGDRALLDSALAQSAASLRINFAGYTSEVRYTDRVLRFPTIFAKNSMFTDERPACSALPDTALLYSTVTGDPGAPFYFPMNAVRWRTPAKDFAALVTDATRDAFAAEVFNFANARTIEAEFFLLDPGNYMLITVDGQGKMVHKGKFVKTETSTRVGIPLPGKDGIRVAVRRVAR